MINFIIRKLYKNFLTKKYKNFFCDINQKFSSIETKNIIENISQKILDISIDVNPTRQLKVAILLPRDIRYLFAIFSVWKTNNIAVNLNIDHSKDYNFKILKKLKPDLLISEKYLFNNFKKKTLLIKKIQKFNKPNITKKKIKLAKFKIAYIIFTSGTTGEPKGVIISAKAYMSYFNWIKVNFKRKLKNKRLLITSQLTFDITFGDLAFAIQANSPICLCNDTKNIFQIFYLIKIYKINVIYSVPSILNKIYMVENDRKSKFLNNIKIIKSGGEPFNIGTYHLMKKLSKKASIYNVYGPTEVTINCSSINLKKNEKIIKKYNQIPIGKIFNHLSYKIFDKNGISTNEGLLFVSGNQIMNGYLNTSVDKNFTYIGKTKYYNTGDLVEKKNENLFLIGRSNSLIKFKGIRFNPTVIDNILLEKNFVKEIKSVIHNQGGKESILIFYRGKIIDQKKVMKEIYKYIPSIIKPLKFIELKLFPLNNSGKYDINEMLKKYV